MNDCVLSICSRLSVLVLTITLFHSCTPISSNLNTPAPVDVYGLENGSANIIHPPSSDCSILSEAIELGPSYQAGRILDIHIDHSNNKHLVIGTDGGGIWRSVDQGLTWNNVSDYLPVMVIKSITQDAINPLIFYAAGFDSLKTEEGQVVADILISRDGAQSFDFIPKPSAVTPQKTRKVVAHPTQAGTLFALHDVIVQVTSQSGIKLNTIRNRLLRSKDYGTTFEEIVPPYALNGTSPENSTNDFTVFDDGGVGLGTRDSYLYSPTGDIGTFKEFPISVSGSCRFVDHCRQNPQNLNMLWSSGGNYSILRSQDAGQTWHTTSTMPAPKVVFGALGVHPTNPDIILGGGLRLNFTIDGGTAFDWVQKAGVDYHSVAFDLIDNRVYIGYDQGLGYLDLNTLGTSEDYTNLSNGIANIMIHRGDYHDDADSVMIGLQDKGTQFNLAGQGSFKGIWGNDGSYCYFDRSDPLGAYASYQSGRIMKANDITQTPMWFPTYIDHVMNELDADDNLSIDEGAAFIHPFWVNYADGNQLYFPTKKRLWRSVNGAQNWNPITNTFPNSFFFLSIDGVSKPNPDVYWSGDDHLYALKNAKTAVPGDMKIIPLESRIRYIKASLLADSTVYVSQLENRTKKLLKISETFGSAPKIENLTGDFPPDLTMYSFAIHGSDQNKILAGTEAGLYYSIDGGQKWKLDPSFPFVLITDIKIRPRDNRIFIFTYGRGAWAANFDDQLTWTVEIPYNGIDDDCDAKTPDDDLDGDGYVLADDCDDQNPLINPDAIEIPYNGIDDDCNPLTPDDDLDGDGYVLAEDCDDRNAAINPGAIDIPNNGIDEDCDGEDAIRIDNISVTIFPNPTTDYIQISVTGDLDFEVSLYSSVGQKLYRAENQLMLDVRDLPGAIYIVEVRDINSDKRYVEKIAVDH